MSERALPRLFVGLERERTDLARPMAFLAVLLKDRRHVLAVGRLRRGRGNLGQRAADGFDVRRLHVLAVQDRGDRVLELAFRRDWRSASGGRRTGRRSGRDSGSGPRRRSRTPRASPWRPSLRANDPCRSRTTGNFKLKSRAWASTSLSLRVGVDADPDPLDRLGGERIDQGAQGRAVAVGDRAFRRVKDERGGSPCAGASD